MKTSDLRAQLDALLRTMFLEGTLRLPPAASRSRTPLKTLARQLEQADPQALEAVRRSGWLDPGAGVYQHLHAFLQQTYRGQSCASEALSEMLLRPPTDRAPERCAVRELGEKLTRQDLLDDPRWAERAMALLATGARNKHIDLCRSHESHQADLVGLLPAVAYETDKLAGAPAETASVAGTILDAISDPADSLGRALRDYMDASAADMYEKWRRPYKIPPSRYFVACLAERRFTSCTSMAQELGIAESSLRQRHLKPFFAKFTAKARDWLLYGDMVRMLKARGCSREDAEAWLQNWGTSLANRRVRSPQAPVKRAALAKTPMVELAC